MLIRALPRATTRSSARRSSPTTASGSIRAIRCSTAIVGADGLKTGHTEEAGYGLTASAVRDGRRLVLVVAGLESAGPARARGRASARVRLSRVQELRAVRGRPDGRAGQRLARRQTAPCRWCRSATWWSDADLRGRAARSRSRWSMTARSRRRSRAARRSPSSRSRRPASSRAAAAGRRRGGPRGRPARPDDRARSAI